VPRQQLNHEALSIYGRNWSNFRNELLNNVSCDVRDDTFAEIPTSGILEFDYVSTARPPPKTTPMDETLFNERMKLIGVSRAISMKAIPGFTS